MYRTKQAFKFWWALALCQIHKLPWRGFASMNRRRIQLSIITFTLLLGSFLFTCGLLVHISHAAFASGPTIQDFYTPAGTNPWGTASDNNGHVWVALPGCDPAPNCSSSTPPGKIAEYDPATSSWINT